MTELDTLFGIEFTILHARIHNFCTRLAFRRWESHWIHLLLESSSNTSYISYEEEYSLRNNPDSSLHPLFPHFPLSRLPPSSSSSVRPMRHLHVSDLPVTFLLFPSFLPPRRRPHRRRLSFLFHCLMLSSSLFSLQGLRPATERLHHVTHRSTMIVRKVSLSLAVILIAGVSQSVESA